jgi:hypothetical protein
MTACSTPAARHRPPLGFIVLSHTAPRQIERLLRRLHFLFDAPPVVCHHDFGQRPWDTSGLPSNIRFVLPHLATGWGEFSLVEATLAALRLLFGRSDAPDWFALLSGADYPVAPAATLLADLRTTAADAFMDFELIDPDCPARDWQRTCARRYLERGSPSPFTRRFRLFAGSQWFTANRRCAEHLLDWLASNESYSLYYRNVDIPDESYFQSALCNEPSLRIAQGNRRYIDWKRGPTVPRILDVSDLAPILASRAHFARKCDLEKEPGLYDILDFWTARNRSQESADQ